MRSEQSVNGSRTVSTPRRFRLTPSAPQNLTLAALASQYAFASSYPLGYALQGTTLGAAMPVSMPAPIMSQKAAEAAQQIAANPHNAATILNQLTSNPENRTAPPAYWFMLMNQHAPANPAAAAMQLRHRDQVATSPANFQQNAAFDMLLLAQGAAAQRDIQIGLELERIRQVTQNLKQRLVMDVQFIESTNDGITLYNERALPVLKAITGVSLGADPDEWKRWWADQLGYVYQSSPPESKPTYTDIVVDPVLSITHSACFAAGTMVQTIDGARPIESIRAGDQVLSQGTSTGTLAFQPVIATHRNSPALTLRIDAGGDSIVATGIHRFWKAGTGWTMARDLKAGDPLRIVGGVVTVDSITPAPAQPVFNLDVARDRNFFVGSQGLLVHDFSFVQPVIEPFDRQPELPKAAPAAR